MSGISNQNKTEPAEPKPARFSTWLLGVSGVLTVAGFLYVCSVQVSLKNQMMLGWAFVILILLVKKAPGANRQLQRVFIVLLCLYLAGRYWFFRTNDTLFYTGAFDVAGMILLYMAECYAILIFVLSMFVNVSPLKRKPVPIHLDDPDLPTVDVFIPTYSEPEEMVAITATAAAQMDYPREKLNIYILDDGATHQKRMDPDPARAVRALQRHETLKNLAAFLEISYTTRGKNDHAKAGNLNQALLRTSHGQIGSALTDPSLLKTEFGKKGGDLVLILDCDHVPAKDFLKNTVGFFQRDEKLFLVQTPHFFINPDPVERNLVTFQDIPGENEMFYGSVLLGLDFWDSAFFCGSAAVLRRKHLTEVGGIAGDTITEDAETALKLHCRGYRSAYVSKPMICGLSPEMFSDFVLQRNRWAQGMTQILLLKNPLTVKGLKLSQRLCYFNNCFFWFFGLARITFLLAPILYLFFGLRVYNATIPQVFAYAIPFLAGSIILSDYLFGKVRRPFFSELYESALSIYNVPAVVGTLFRPRSPQFKVTPKDRSLSSDFVSPLAIPFYVLLLVLLAAYPMAVSRWIRFPLEHDVLLIAVFWSTFNLLYVLLCLGVVLERRQIRRKHRITTCENVFLHNPENGKKFPAVVRDLSEDGVGLQINNEFHPAKGDRIELQAQDSYGNRYNLPIEVVRTVPGEKSSTVGCLFVVDDELTFTQIVAYVYGDSERWNNFWLKRRGGYQSITGSIGYLLLKSIRGSARNLATLTALFLKKTKQVGVDAWVKKANYS